MHSFGARGRWSWELKLIDFDDIRVEFEWIFALDFKYEGFKSINIVVSKIEGFKFIKNVYLQRI